MKITLQANPNFWVPVPANYPTDEFASGYRSPDGHRVASVGQQENPGFLWLRTSLF